MLQITVKQIWNTTEEDLWTSFIKDVRINNIYIKISEIIEKST